MNVSSVLQSFPANYKNDNAQLNDVNKPPGKPVVVSNKNQDTSQQASGNVERIRVNDISLYQDIEHYTQRSSVEKLLSFSIHV